MPPLISSSDLQDNQGHRQNAVFELNRALFHAYCFREDQMDAPQSHLRSSSKINELTGL